MPRTKETFEAMRENTRKKIETAAISLFARNGLSVTVDEIARMAGISKGLLYNHYQSKEALIAELAQGANEISGQSIKALAMYEDTALNKIKQVTTIMVGMIQDQHVGINSFMFMIQVGMSGFQLPPEVEYSEETPNPIESLAKIITQGQTEGSVVDGEAIQLSITYWAVIQGLCCYVAARMPIATNSQMLNRILLKEQFI